MTALTAPRPDDSFTTFRPLFQRLEERALDFAARAANANERANAFVKSLELFHLERRFFSEDLDDAASPLADWRRRVESALQAIRAEISTVESKTERAYLRRLALDATLALNDCDETFFAAPTADAFLAEIDDAEERQNALVAYSARLAVRIARFQRSENAAPERAQAFAFLEEIEDLRLFERAAANVLSAVLFDATRRIPAPAASRLLPAADATLDLTAFGADVGEVWEQFESPGGFLELCERAAVAAFALRPALSTPSAASNAPSASAPSSEVALLQSLNDETRRRLTAILAALDSGVDADGSPLDEDALSELQSVVDEAVIASPFALEKGEFFRAFLERSRNLDAYLPIFERLAEAEKAVAATPADAPSLPATNDATECFYSIYQHFPNSSAEFFADEKTRWLESARRVATRSATFEADRRVKLDRLTTSVELEFRFGDKNLGKNAVREALGLLPRLESPFERARLYRRLVAAHLVASYPKAAQKLASLWKAELDAIEPEDLRDAALADAFELYAQVANLDATAVSAFLATISAPLVRLDCETRFELARLCAPFPEPRSDARQSSKRQEVANQTEPLIESFFASLGALNETAPDEAVFALVKIATALANRLGVAFAPDARATFAP